MRRACIPAQPMKPPLLFLLGVAVPAVVADLTLDVTGGRIFARVRETVPVVLFASDQTDGGQISVEISAHQERLRENLAKRAGDGFKLRTGEVEQREPLAEQAAGLERAADVLEMFQRKKAGPPRCAMAKTNRRPPRRIPRAGPR